MRGSLVYIATVERPDRRGVRAECIYRNCDYNVLGIGNEMDRLMGGRKLILQKASVSALRCSGVWLGCGDDSISSRVPDKAGLHILGRSRAYLPSISLLAINRKSTSIKQISM